MRNRNLAVHGKAMGCAGYIRVLVRSLNAVEDVAVLTVLKVHLGVLE